LETAVYWSALLIKQGQKERALTYLTIVARHPLFLPPNSTYRLRQQASRLLAELQATLSLATVADIKLKARQCTLDSVVAELLALPQTEVLLS
jgi:hypothetical protein